MQRHTGEDWLILRQRKATYEAAKQAKPDRWKNRKTRCWDHIREVWLNPSKTNKLEVKSLKLAA